jgi:prolyl oligopeptidase
MENSDSRELNKWIAAQTHLADTYLAGPEYSAIRTRLEELGRFDLGFAGRLRGNRLFYELRPKDGGPVELRIVENGDSRRLLRSDEIPDNEYEDTLLGGSGLGVAHWPDRAGNLVAYAYTNGTSQSRRVRILDARSGKHLPDVLEELVGGISEIEWSVTGEGFFYYRARTAAVEGTSGTRTEPVGLYYHTVGTPQDEDRAILTQVPGDRHTYLPRVSAKGRYLVVRKREGTAIQTSYLVFDTRALDATPLHLFADADARYLYLGNEGTRFFFQTTAGGPNGRVIAVDLHAPDKVVEIVPEAELPMLAGSNVGGDIIAYHHGYLVLGYLRDGTPEVRVHDSTGDYKRTLQLPPGTTIWGGFHGAPGDPRVTASLLSAMSPGEIVTIDLHDGSIRSDYSADVPFDREDFVIKRVSYESKDGTRVPMFIVHRRNVELDGRNPALIYGYGMHKWVSFLFYQAHVIHWLELGGVYAMPAIRGGGEFGDDWHEAGIKLNRQNAIDDFVWAGKWLINAGYTSPDRLAANGGSASGPLAGIVPLQYAAVFAAATVDFPVLDLLRAPLYGNGALLTEEYGSRDIEAEFRAMIEQSPYHQALATSGCLLPTFLLVGENDRTVLPFHGYKYTAAMQHAQRCDNPILIKTMYGTGHNYGLTPEAYAENAGAQLAFLKRVLAF